MHSETGKVVLLVFVPATTCHDYRMKCSVTGLFPPHDMAARMSLKWLRQGSMSNRP